MAGTPQEPGVPRSNGRTVDGGGDALDGAGSVAGPGGSRQDARQDARQDPSAASTAASTASANDEPDEPDEPDEEECAPSGFDQWRRRSATGAVLTGIALGLQEVFTPTRDLPAIVVTADDGADDPPRAVEVHLDPDNPAATVAVVRPWLGRGGTGGKG
ncbi:MAG: hypothetical protein ACP5P9_02110 [Acidimicrobiales bacterium]